MSMRTLVRQIDNRYNWRQIAPMVQAVIDDALTLQQIPGPTFHEEARATHVEARFRELGLQQVERDENLNVYGLLAGRNREAPALLLCAHTDTVFPLDTDLQIRHVDNLIYAPGLGDNSLGVAALFGFIQFLHQTNTLPDRDIWLVATSCEEGLGNLKGIRSAYERLKDHINVMINIEGLAFGYVFHAGIAVQRLRITAQTEGGHSWIHYGRPSAIHALANLATQIIRLKPPFTPRTTFNIGLIEGGTTINTIASKASLWLDLRSENQTELERLSDQVQRLVQNARRSDTDFVVEIVGDRPAGAINHRHPLVQGALEALTLVKVRGGLEMGSTDANIPLAAGCPAVTIGITRGENAHRLDEYIEVEPIADGMRQLITLVLATAEYQDTITFRAAGD